MEKKMVIEKKLKRLPLNLQKEVSDFVEFLIQKNEKSESEQSKRPYALCKGEIKISDDFNASMPEDVMKEWGIL